MALFFKIIGFLFSVLFLVAAALQYNDPDALLWISVWVIAALISFLFAQQKVSQTITLIMAILTLLAGMYVYPTTFEGLALNDGELKNVELGREAYGLFIIAVLMCIYTLRIRYTKRHSNKNFK